VVAGESGEAGNPGTLGMTKGKGNGPIGSGCRTEAFFVNLDGSQVQDNSGDCLSKSDSWGLRPVPPSVQFPSDFVRTKRGGGLLRTQHFHRVYRGCARRWDS
jgi:hypothetical protein